MDSSSASFTARLAATATHLVQVKQCAVEANRRASEAVWTHILNDTVCESDWFTNRNLLPHQYAPGHQTLYVLYRILNESHPSKILCVGHGAMFQVVSQYARSNKEVKVMNIESYDDSYCDLGCIDMGLSVAILPNIKLSEHGTIIINDVRRVLKNNDIDKYANLISGMGKRSVVGRYEGFGMCYVVTGKDNVYLMSM